MQQFEGMQMVLHQQRYSTSPSVQAVCYKNWDFGWRCMRGCWGRLCGEIGSCLLVLNSVPGSAGRAQPRHLAAGLWQRTCLWLECKDN